MSLTVGDLMSMLEGLDEDMEVRFASQPSWPFEYSIDRAEVVDLNNPEEYEVEDSRIDETPDQEPQEPDEVLYLVEGNQIGYLPSVVVQAVGWGRDR